MSLVADFKKLLQSNASDVRYHRSDSLVVCPCRTPEGFRDPAWHLQHPTSTECDATGMLPQPGTTADAIVKAFIQPIQSTRATRLSTEQILQMFGEVEADDHLGIFPYEWNNLGLNFFDWGRAGEDFVEYFSRRFTVVNANLIPDPSDGNPAHHWEVGLRLIGEVP